jgi:hypothetical protein
LRIVIMHATPWKYLDEKERAAIEVKNRAAFCEAFDKICEALGRAGIAFQRKYFSQKQMAESPWAYDCGYLISVDGYDVSGKLKITVPQEHGHPEYAGKWHMKAAIRVQIGNILNVVRFVEGKKGLDHDLIAKEIVAWVARQRASDEAHRHSLIESVRREKIVQGLNEKYAVKSTFPGLSDRWDSSHPMAKVGSGESIEVCLPGMPIDKAEAILDFARKLGL